VFFFYFVSVCALIFHTIVSNRSWKEIKNQQNYVYSLYWRLYCSATSLTYLYILNNIYNPHTTAPSRNKNFIVLPVLLVVKRIAWMNEKEKSLSRATIVSICDLYQKWKKGLSLFVGSVRPLRCPHHRIAVKMCLHYKNFFPSLRQSFSVHLYISSHK